MVREVFLITFSYSFFLLYYSFCSLWGLEPRKQPTCQGKSLNLCCKLKF
nr:MAG TPA: hypothetical protein [Caudoviricetes sp.]